MMKGKLISTMISGIWYSMENLAVDIPRFAFQHLTKDILKYTMTK